MQLIKLKFIYANFYKIRLNFKLTKKKVVLLHHQNDIFKCIFKRKLGIDLKQCRPYTGIFMNSLICDT